MRSGKFATNFFIEKREIGPNKPPYVIAEMASSHNGKLKNALKLVEHAKKSGADAIKLQCYKPDTITLNHDSPAFTLSKGPWAGRTLHSLYTEAYTPREWFKEIFEKAQEVGITCFSSVFSPDDVDFLERLGCCPAYKVSSFDIEDISLIERIVKTNKPVIISTGMASWQEICDCDNAIPPEYPHAFLHCVSGYPTPTAEANLWKIEELKGLGLPVGLSDHTMSYAASMMAVALGACIIEKHIKLNGSNTGPDDKFSLPASLFAAHVSCIKTAHAAMMQRHKYSEDSSRLARKSVWVVKDLAAGDVLTPDNIRPLRPSGGLSPALYPDVLGRTVQRSLSRGSPLSLDDLSEQSQLPTQPQPQRKVS